MPKKWTQHVKFQRDHQHCQAYLKYHKLCVHNTFLKHQDQNTQREWDHLKFLGLNIPILALKYFYSFSYSKTF